MDGVTDAAFRYMVGKYGSRHSGSVGGGVDVMFTEFVSVDALHFASGERRERLLKTFIRAKDVDGITNPDSNSFPYEVAQIFGHTPEYFAEAADLINTLGFDGIDINMGCPAHKVEEQGSGAGLIRTPELAQEIVRTVKAHTSLPVSVKTRIGVDHSVVEEWMEALMEVRPIMISLHGRTLKQLYQGTADWEAIGKAAKIVHQHGGHILGNGDIKEMSDVRRKISEYGVDGVLIGRAAEGNPWVFTGEEASREQKLTWIVEHAKKFDELFVQCHSDTVSQHKAFLPVRKHLAWYAHGFPGAVELRANLVQANEVAEVEQMVALC
jgi:nifR3 family TIM-barrel protein